MTNKQTRKNINCYPLIFKQKVVEFYNTNSFSAMQVAQIFSVGRTSIFRWARKYKDNKLTEKLKYFHKKKKISTRVRNYICNKVIRNCVVDTKDIIKRIKNYLKVIISKASIYNILKKNNITRKMVRSRTMIKNKQKHKKDICEFKKNIRNKSRRNIISIDEVSVDTHISQNFQWSKKGVRIEKIHTRNRQRFTVTCAISDNKIIHYTITKNSSNAIIFKDFLIELYNKVGNKHYFLLDNARIHHAKIIKECVDEYGLKMIYNAPYSPQFNPIESVFSKTKNTLAKYDNSLPTDLRKNISYSFAQITPNDLQNFYRNSLPFCKI